MKSTMVLAVILSLPGPGFADDNGSDTGWQYERRQNDGERTMGDEARRFPAPENGDENRGYGEGDNQREWGNDGNRGDGEYGNKRIKGVTHKSSSVNRVIKNEVQPP